MRSQLHARSFKEALGQSFNARTVIIGVTLLLAWLLGQAPDIRYIGISVLIGLCLLVIRYPAMGILWLIVSSLLVPLSIGTGTQTQLPPSFVSVPLLAVLWFLGNITFKRPLSPIYSRVTLALIGLVMTATLSFVSGYLPWNAFASLAPLRAQIGGWALFAFSAGALLLTGLYISSVRWLKVIVAIFLVSASFLLIGRLAPELSFFSRLVVNSAVGSVFWIWITVLAAGQLLFNNKLQLYIKGLLVAFLVIIALVSFATSSARDWASGWFPPLIGLACLIALRLPRATVVAVCFGLIVAVIGYQSLIAFVLSGDNSYSLLTRGAAMDVLLKIIQVEPWLGLGPANYYYYTPLYPILGYYVSFNSHNQYIDIIAQIGIIGMIFYLWTFAEIILLGWRLRKRVISDGFASGYVNACIAGAIGMLAAGVLADWVIPFVYNIGVAGFRASVLGWIFLGGLLALNHIYLSEPEPSTVIKTPPVTPRLTAIAKPAAGLK